MMKRNAYVGSCCTIIFALTSATKGQRCALLQASLIDCRRLCIGSCSHRSILRHYPAADDA